MLIFVSVALHTLRTYTEQSDKPPSHSRRTTSTRDRTVLHQATRRHSTLLPLDRTCVRLVRQATLAMQGRSTGRTQRACTASREPQPTIRNWKRRSRSSPTVLLVSRLLRNLAPLYPQCPFNLQRIRRLSDQRSRGTVLSNKRRVILQPLSTDQRAYRTPRRVAGKRR